jgi:amidase
MTIFDSDPSLGRRDFLATAGSGVAGALTSRALASAATWSAGSAVLTGCRAEGGAVLPTDLTAASAATLAQAIRRKQVSSLEVVEAHLARISAVNPALNAVVQVTGEAARAAARAVDQAIARRESIGPLHGVPMTIKDSLDTEGVVTTGGTVGRRETIPAADATVVRRLKAAGAILLGKTNTPELTLSYETNNPISGRTNNPWDPNRTSGGSSGGAGAIVAARGAPFDIGSDTGGSIRVPAHFCGICGIKPTSGRVPRTGHIIPAEGHLQAWTQLGPLARTVADLELVLRVIAGPDWRDAAVTEMPLGDAGAVSVKTLRVAWHADNGIMAPTPEIAAAVRVAAEAIASAGAMVEEQRPDGLAEGFQLAAELYGGDGGAWIRRLLDRAGTTEPGPELAGLLGVLTAVPAAELTARIERWDGWRGRMLAFLERYDAIVCPPNAIVAPPHGGTNPVFPAFSYTFCYNMTGWPAAVVPAGLTAEGLPHGVQIVGRPWREDVVLALAGTLETALGGFRPVSSEPDRRTSPR